MQKLLMPFKTNRVYASYKTKAYNHLWGYEHYGIDIASKWDGGSGEIYASGNGVVLAVGKDNTLGYGVAIRYDKCYNRKTNSEVNVTIRYMHLEKCFVKCDDNVDANTLIGIEGNAGTKDPHLHIEADTDTRTRYATYSPQVSANHTFWKKGYDSTINISELLHCSQSRRLIKASESDFISNDDKNFPSIEVDEMEKKSVNENIPVVFENDEEYIELYGAPVWCWHKMQKYDYAKLFYDKYWRKIPSFWSDYAGEFADDVAIANARPYDEEKDGAMLVIDGDRVMPTDKNEYDENGNIINDGSTPTPKPDETSPSIDDKKAIKALRKMLDENKNYQFLKTVDNILKEMGY